MGPGSALHPAELRHDHARLSQPCAAPSRQGRPGAPRFTTRCRWAGVWAAPDAAQPPPARRPLPLGASPASPRICLPSRSGRTFHSASTVACHGVQPHHNSAVALPGQHPAKLPPPLPLTHCDVRTLPGGRTLPCGCAAPAADPKPVAAEPAAAAAPVPLRRALLPPCPPLVQLGSRAGAAAAAAAAASSCTVKAAFACSAQRCRQVTGGHQQLQPAQHACPPSTPTSILPACRTARLRRLWPADHDVDHGRVGAHHVPQQLKEALLLEPGPRRVAGGLRGDYRQQLRWGSARLAHVWWQRVWCFLSQPCWGFGSTAAAPHQHGNSPRCTQSAARRSATDWKGWAQ